MGYHDLEGRPGFKMAMHERAGRWFLYLGQLWHRGWSIVDVKQRYARERGLVQEVDQPGDGTVRVPGPTIRFVGQAPQPIRPAPRLGEHTFEDLREILGMTDDELGRAAAAGIVAGLPPIPGGVA